MNCIKIKTIRKNMYKLIIHKKNKNFFEKSVDKWEGISYNKDIKKRENKKGKKGSSRMKERKKRKI